MFAADQMKDVQPPTPDILNIPREHVDVPLRPLFDPILERQHLEREFDFLMQQALADDLEGDAIGEDGQIKELVTQFEAQGAFLRVYVSEPS
jgi:hypothetical protein